MAHYFTGMLFIIISLRDKDGFIRFIDFDLACTGPAGTEIALWIHRVLPQIDYDIRISYE